MTKTPSKDRDLKYLTNVKPKHSLYIHEYKTIFLTLHIVNFY